jgi:ABC-type histidine transport system ATPase subunit
VVTSKEAAPISGNLIFQISQSSRFPIKDLHNAYLRLEVEKQFTYTYNAGDAIANNGVAFFGDNTQLISLKNLEFVVMIILSLRI